MEQLTDVEMMETETGTATAPSTQPQDMAATANGGQDNADWDLLALARQLINQGKPSQALQAVVMAMRTRGGDEAVFHSLHRARELYKSRLQENVAVDQLASLFAECVIAEAQPLGTEQPQDNAGDLWVMPDAHGSSILAETGRMQVVLDAFSDGSSFICLKCGGLVSNHRKDEHYAYWCCQL